jgi:5-methylcytosine-specific restriction endonuclease McrA
MDPRTLVLTPSMTPIRIASWQESVVLVWQDKADALECYEATVSSPSVTLAIPAVVRLHKSVHMHRGGVKFSRINVLSRDSLRCCYCGEKKKARELNYDHVVPRSRGGKTVWQNIVTSCLTCNRRKGNRTPAEAGMRMHFKPYVPTTIVRQQPLLFLLDAAPEQWAPYLGLETGAQAG